MSEIDRLCARVVRDQSLTEGELAHLAADPGRAWVADVYRARRSMPAPAITPEQHAEALAEALKARIDSSVAEALAAQKAR